MIMNAVGLPLSDAKEFAMDRSGGQCLYRTLASFLAARRLAMMALVALVSYNPLAGG
jgi:hypothetical protein